MDFQQVFVFFQQDILQLVSKKMPIYIGVVGCVAASRLKQNKPRLSVVCFPSSCAEHPINQPARNSTSDQNFPSQDCAATTDFETKREVQSVRHFSEVVLGGNDD